MNRNVRLSLALRMLTGALLGCGADRAAMDIPEGFERHTFEGGISMVLPADWEVAIEGTPRAAVVTPETELPDDATMLVEFRSPESQGYAAVAAVRYPPQKLPERELALIHASEFEATGRQVVDEIGEHFEWVEFEYAGLTRVRAGNLALETRYRRRGWRGRSGPGSCKCSAGRPWSSSCSPTASPRRSNGRRCWTRSRNPSVSPADDPGNGSVARATTPWESTLAASLDPSIPRLTRAHGSAETAVFARPGHLRTTPDYGDAGGGRSVLHLCLPGAGAPVA